MSTPRQPAAFHAGEQALQAQSGLAERMREIGPRVIRDHMPDQHRELFEELPMVFLGHLDEQGRPWATVLTGVPGFLSTPDAYTLRIEGAVDLRDPLRAQLHMGSPVGLLGIQLETRRRNRMNGRVSGLRDELVEVRVEQSFGNCPKYIHTRRGSFRGGGTRVDWGKAVPEGPLLSARAAHLVRSADTFFIASASAGEPQGPAQGVDVSHRGGPAGFVALEQGAHESVLTAPDYVGNFFFNTLGNLSVYPRAGLLFCDFDSGDLLSLTVDSELLLDGEQLAGFPGAQRLTRFQVRAGHYVSAALPLRFAESRET